MMKKIISMGFKLKDDYVYPFFLISLASFLFIPSIIGGTTGELLSNVLFILLIISSLALVDSKSKVIRIIVYIVGIVGIVSEIIHEFIHPLSNSVQAIFMVITFIYFIAIFIELIRQIFTSEQVTLNLVLGAFTGYIMIGIIGFFVFRIIFLLDPSSFAIPTDSYQDLIYFSFVTLTTIGYGDISPLSEAARNFAILLGLVGQFYNTVIIAIIIGKFLQK